MIPTTYDMDAPLSWRVSPARPRNAAETYLLRIEKVFFDVLLVCQLASNVGRIQAVPMFAYPTKRVQFEDIDNV